MARSAGILLYRLVDGVPQVLIVHPGGPFWARKDAGAWSIPKGEYGDDEDAQACALREFEEETGTALSPAALADLGSVRQKGGKEVTAWAVEGDLDADAIVSTRSSWSGRRARVGCRRFPRWTGRPGSGLRRRARSSTPRRVRS